MNKLVRLAALFLSKFGAVIVGVLFLPIYRELLGNDAFGVVAVILSIQAFALMSDFGLSVLVSRDIAHFSSDTSAGSLIWRQSGLALVAVYVAVLTLSLAAFALTGAHSQQCAIVAICVVLFLFTVLQNLGQSALLAKKQFVVASSVQVGGVLFRAVTTVSALSLGDASLLTFVFIQATTTALHFAATHYLCSKAFSTPSGEPHPRLNWSDITPLLQRGRPLLLSGLAGAAVLQLDKPILAAFVSAGDVAPYFLAMSFSVLPTSLLGSPVVQYFQPQIIQLMTTPQTVGAQRTIAQFTLTLLLVVAVPSWILWQWIEPLMQLWLRDPVQAAVVAAYAKILLPSFALGGLCFVPVVLLMASQDFKYQAITSTLMTITTLLLVLVGAKARRVDWVCFAYLAYFIAASASVWWRALILPSTRHLARISASKSLAPLLSLFLLAVIFIIYK